MGRKRTADIACIPTGEGVSCLAGIVRLLSRKIIGWSMNDTLHIDLCVEAMVIRENDGRSCPGLHHSAGTELSLGEEGIAARTAAAIGKERGAALGMTRVRVNPQTD